MLRRIRSHHTFMVGFSHAVVRSLMRPIFVYLTFLTGTLLVLDATVFWWLEDGLNPRMNGWFDSLYFTVTTLTGVGFGDIVPVTRPGKVLAMLTMLGGTALFVAYTATLASSILETELKLGRRHDRSP